MKRCWPPQAASAFGLLSFCGARIQPGFEVVAEAVGLESKNEDADW